MGFNFGNLANAKPATTTSYLKPYNIYENVTIKNTEVKEGTSQTGNAWKCLVITFGNDEGTFSHSIFYFDEKDSKNWERGTYPMPNGGTRELPSKAEELQNTISAIGFAFFPEDFKKLQQVAAKVTTTEQLMTYFKQFVDKNLDKNPTCMKLVGRNNNGAVYASFPKFTGIAQATTQDKAEKNGVQLNEWYTWTVSPFNNNSAKLAFSSYEQQQANSYNNAKPTKMDAEINNISEIKSEEVDFDELLGGL